MKTPARKRRAAASPAPKQPFVMSLRLPPELVADLDAIAAQESRSRAKQIEVLLRQGVQQYRQKAAA